MQAGKGFALLWMILPDEKICVISDSDIFGAGYRKSRRNIRTGEKLCETEPLSSVWKVRRPADE